GWRGRWFTLRTATGSPDRYVLEYAEDKKKKPSCQIDLTHCTYVVALKPMVIKDNYKHVFTVKTTKQQYYLVASSETDMTGWISVLCRVCGLSSLCSSLVELIDSYVI
ncbi:hypothetical protein BV898_20092, partial [Hypsibius exemplaris]